MLMMSQGTVLVVGFVSAAVMCYKLSSILNNLLCNFML